MRCLKNASFVYSPRGRERGRGGAIGWFKGFDLLGRRWGFDRSLVLVDDEPYLDRWILYINGYTLRLHKFYRGDDDRASHTHPWWFITFPLRSYTEKLFAQGRYRYKRTVRAWRFHYRPTNFEHYVVDGMTGTVPWWYTIVLTGPKNDTWGFYPAPGHFVPWREWR